MGHEKGHTTETRVKHNFGMARPEGYRKAQRLMDMAERFNLPIVTFVDTAGAFPGADAEERGQSEAIAVPLKNVFKSKFLSPPSSLVKVGPAAQSPLPVATMSSCWNIPFILLFHLRAAPLFCGAPTIIRNRQPMR